VSSTTDFVVAVSPTGGDLAIQVRGLRTNGLFANYSIASAGVGVGNGYIANQLYVQPPTSPLYFATTDSIAAVDLSTGTLLRVLPTVGSLTGGGVLFVPNAGADVVQFSIPGTGPHRDAQLISPTGAVLETTALAPQDLLTGCSAGALGVILPDSGAFLASAGTVWVWDLPSNTWVNLMNVTLSSPVIRQIAIAGATGTPVAGALGTYASGEFIWSGAGVLDNGTGLVTAGAIAAATSPGDSAAGRYMYATGYDGTNINLYRIDTVLNAIHTVTALPAVHGLPDSMCVSYDGTAVYCLCSTTADGYPVDLNTLAIGPIDNWGIASPQRVTLWPVPGEAAPWVLAHVEVAPAPSPWLVGAVP
jgi:hypothetical protein